DQAFQFAQELSHRSRPMTQQRLDRVAQLREGRVIFGDFEVRIVTEAPFARRAVDDSSATGPFAIDHDLAARVGQTRVTDVMSRASGAPRSDSCSLALFVASVAPTPEKRAE